MKRLAVIPSDPLDEYKIKGTGPLYEDYFNPGHWFDEVYCLSPLESKEYVEFGMKVIPTKDRELKKRLRDLEINILRAYGGNWPCDMACNFKVRDIPVVVSVHDRRTEWLHHSIKKAGYVFAVSEEVKELVSSKTKNEENVWILPNKIDFDVMRHRGPEELNDLTDQYLFKYKILQVGRKSPEKNIETIIKALKVLGEEYCLISIGKGETASLVELAKEHSVLDQCFFIENVLNEELPRYYSLADCLCNPSHTEAMSFVLIEALACECIVVTSSVAARGVNIINRDNGLTLSDSNNPEALAKILRVACTDQKIREAVRKNTRKSVEPYEKNHMNMIEIGYYKKILEMNQNKKMKKSLKKNVAEHAAKIFIRSSKRHNLVKNYLSALNWIKENTLSEKGIVVTSNQKVPYLEVTGYLIPTLIDAGEMNLAERYAKFLSYMQRPSGAFTGPDGKEYIFDTAQVLRGLLKAGQYSEHYLSAASRSADFLVNSMTEHGQLPANYKDKISEYVHLYTLPALMESGQVLNNPRYADMARKSLNYYKSQNDILNINLLTHFLGYIIDGFIDMNEKEFVRPAVEQVFLNQKEDGSIPAFPDVDWICSTGVAQFAVIGYKLGFNDQADRAVEYLCSIQNPSGGFYGSYGRKRTYFPNEEISWANKFFLDAIHCQRTTFFNKNSSIFPSEISANDGRLQKIFHYLGDLDGKKICDAGCGKGRFAIEIKKKYPECEVHGVDISSKQLEDIPDSILKKQGSILNLPYDFESFDAVICVEALEHAINTERAVEEICRIVKENGKIVIIDKNIKKLGQHEIVSFEQWFDRNELTQMLKKFCYDVHNEEISYDKSSADGLFLSWCAAKGTSVLDEKQWHEAIIGEHSVDDIVKKIQSNQLPEWINPILESTKRDDSILELGSGTGELSAILALNDRRTTVIDYSQESLMFAQELYSKLNLRGEFECADILKGFSLNDSSVDWVFSSGVLEHFSDETIIQILKDSCRVCTKGVMSLVPNSRSLFYRIGKSKMEKEGKWPYGRETPKPTMKPQFESAGLKNVRETTIGTYHSLKFWGDEFKEIKGFLDSLSEKELEDLDQGYLIFTYGEKQ